MDAIHSCSPGARGHAEFMLTAADKQNRRVLYMPKTGMLPSMMPCCHATTLLWAVLGGRVALSCWRRAGHWLCEWWRKRRGLTPLLESVNGPAPSCQLSASTGCKESRTRGVLAKEAR